jgi:transposase
VWTHKHEVWLLGQRFDEPALRSTYAHYRAVVASRDAQLDAVEADLAGWVDQPPFAAQVARLAAYRGVTRLGGLTLAAEVGDWRRFARAAQFMGFCGLVPSEYSSGHSVHRGRVPHVFQAYYPILDEAAAALDRAGQLLSAHLASAEQVAA